MPPSSGRPREFTRPKRSQLIRHIGQGASLAQAAKIVGVSLRTVQREAKTDDEFHHDLALAQDDAPVDPERQLNRAARAHWRAAAWMLERSNPDRYGKRPAKSCSPDKLRDMINYLIELALEAAPREHHQAIYRHMRPAAEAACAMLIPDHHESQRWMRALVTRPMRLSENVRDELRLRDMCNPGYFDSLAPSSQASPPCGSDRRNSAEFDEDREDDEQEDDDQQAENDFDQDDDDDAALTFREKETVEKEVRAAYAERKRGFNIMANRRAPRRWLDKIYAEFAARRTASTTGASATADAAPAESIDTASNEPSNEGDALPTTGAPPCGGIMSPKMQFGDDTPATECDADLPSDSLPLRGEGWGGGRSGYTLPHPSLTLKESGPESSEKMVTRLA